MFHGLKYALLHLATLHLEFQIGLEQLARFGAVGLQFIGIEFDAVS